MAKEPDIGQNVSFRLMLHRNITRKPLKDQKAEQPYMGQKGASLGAFRQKRWQTQGRP